MPGKRKEHWKTKIGVIMAVAGSAIGLGNFLRFPGMAAQFGGGAFMIAYFCAFLLIGLPICWVEWSMGRRAGRHGMHGVPFMLVAITRKPIMRYVGIFMLLIPSAIYIYYINIEAWCLGYAANFATDTISLTNATEAGHFFAHFVGLSGDGSALGLGLSKCGVYLLICVVLNFFLLFRGISRGIEKFCLVATPALFVIALIVLIRVLTIGTPDPASPYNSITNGLGYMWNPDKVVLEQTVDDGSTYTQIEELVGDAAIAEASARATADPNLRLRTINMWEQLCNPQMWMSAAAQIFFSLSIGFCLIFTYASYLHKKADVVLGALSAASANEFAEIGFGGLLSIPAGVAFLGVAGVAGTGTFGLGFNVLPIVFSQMPGGAFFGFLFFTLLFIAAVTSSISMLQPLLSYVEETMTITRRQSVGMLGMITTLGAIFVAYFSDGLVAIDTLDFWFGTFMIFLMATVQMIVFAWMVGVDTIWAEMRRGASFMPNRIFRIVIKWISPLFLIVVGLMWVYFELLNLDGGEPSSYVKNLFIKPNSVAVMSVLFMILMGVFLAMILKPKKHFIRLAIRSKRIEKEDAA